MVRVDLVDLGRVHVADRNTRNRRGDPIVSRGLSTLAVFLDLMPVVLGPPEHYEWRGRTKWRIPTVLVRQTENVGGMCDWSLPVYDSLEALMASPFAMWMENTPWWVNKGGYRADVDESWFLSNRLNEYLRDFDEGHLFVPFFWMYLRGPADESHELVGMTDGTLISNYPEGGRFLTFNEKTGRIEFRKRTDVGRWWASPIQPVDFRYSPKTFKSLERMDAYPLGKELFRSFAEKNGVALERYNEKGKRVRINVDDYPHQFVNWLAHSLGVRGEGVIGVVHEMSLPQVDDIGGYDGMALKYFAEVVRTNYSNEPTPSRLERVELLLHQRYLLPERQMVEGKFVRFPSSMEMHVDEGDEGYVPRGVVTFGIPPFGTLNRNLYMNDRVVFSGKD